MSSIGRWLVFVCAAVAASACASGVRGVHGGSDSGSASVDSGRTIDAGARDANIALDARNADAAMLDAAVVGDSGVKSDGSLDASVAPDAAASRPDAGPDASLAHPDAGQDASLVRPDAGPAPDSGPAGPTCELPIQDVTSGTRTPAAITGTEYFYSTHDDMLPGTSVYLISADGTFTFDYAGTVAPGYLIINHTFDTSAPTDYTVDLTYVDLSGVSHALTVYFPAFTTSGGRKMYFLVGSDGSTYYLDAENDGLSDETTEGLPRSVACTDAHLARRAPPPP